MVQNLSLSPPSIRKIRGYAFDPSLSLKIDTATINKLTYSVPWEDNLEEGPKGEYLEIIDYDPTTGKFYKPIDLDERYLLAQDGLPPSESNPQFHQQMVYAVAMTTITNFEKALGRQIMWSPHATTSAIDPSKLNKKFQNRNYIPKKSIKYDFVQRLRIYPHALRDANAYYSPQKKALLFGYFATQETGNLIMPNSLVFTCLSHDIIAHETTHAILDGMYRRYTEATNPDVLAFHEAFSDIVALFQHFTFPEVLKHQIAKTRGDLASQNLLGQLAQEFGTAIGHYGALRDAIGYLDKITGEWKIRIPNGDEYQMSTEPHARGAVLVSAVFDAFLTIYKDRISDLLRIASQGSGILPKGELSTDLVNRLAHEASKSASHVLGMCIRALDYCPPVDITFDDFLRGIITADIDLVKVDKRHYRIAFIEAFRKRGIYPSGIRNLSVESLSYPIISEEDKEPIKDQLLALTKYLREFNESLLYETDRKNIYEKTGEHIRGKFVEGEPIIQGLHRHIRKKMLNSKEFQLLTGLVFKNDWTSLGIPTSFSQTSIPNFEVHSLKVANRNGPDGNRSSQIIMTLIQRSGIKKVERLPNGQTELETYEPNLEYEMTGDQFIMTGGCTLIFDLHTLTLKHAIIKPLLNLDLLRSENKYEIDSLRALRIKEAFTRDSNNIYESYFGLGRKFGAGEPFSFLHQH